jgi:hypothetical protein
VLGRVPKACTTPSACPFGHDGATTFRLAIRTHPRPSGIYIGHIPARPHRHWDELVTQYPPPVASVLAGMELNSDEAEIGGFLDAIAFFPQLQQT